MIILVFVLLQCGVFGFATYHPFQSNTQTIEFRYRQNAATHCSPRSQVFSTSVERKTDETPHKQKWKPKVKSLEERRKLRNRFHNSETIGSIAFHHVEFYCGDAKSTAIRFALALGMRSECQTDQSTGNDVCASYGLRSGDIRFIFTAPYAESTAGGSDDEMSSANNNAVFSAPRTMPGYNNAEAHNFFQKHGLAAKAVCIKVRNADRAYHAAVSNGAEGALEPTDLSPCTALENNPDFIGWRISEVVLYGDVTLRFLSSPLSCGDDDSFLPHMAPMSSNFPSKDYGLRRIDHAVGNVPDLFEAFERIRTFTGFHEFAEFTSEDVGTFESGLNSVVLASDSEKVLIPLSEPVEGRRKSQIQTFLEQNNGAGLQHLALKTDDIFHTVRQMRNAEAELGGFELMRRPGDDYYKELPQQLGDSLTPEQYKQLEELGILADADDEGTLFQIFTKPLSDRPTLFIEIIQRIGCPLRQVESLEIGTEATIEDDQRPGCGGFGLGNFKALFKAIEDHEKSLKV